MKRLLSIALIGISGFQGVSVQADSRPKLVVGIVVDQLRTDYLENLKDMLSAGGFRKLMQDGLYFKDVDFKVPGGDPASASAIIQTGSYPRVNGITSSRIYDTQAKTLKSVFHDETYIGNFTDEKYSPSALRVSTLADELAVEGEGQTKIHSIAPDAAQAIVLAGHSGNSAFWINDDSGRWSSTTYYSNPPNYLQNKNYNDPIISRLDTIKWEPLKFGEPYPYVSAREIKDGFKYTFLRSDRDVFSLYKNSPFVNSDISEAASAYITELQLGKNGEATDVLNLGFSLAPYPGMDGSNPRYELEDAYLRLDKDLEILFNTIDKEVGKDNTLIYLISTGYFKEPLTKGTDYKLPGGNFSVKRATSLLNSYLSAKYGNGSYIDHYYDSHLFLSKETLEEKNLGIKDVAEEARDFLVRMSGVADVYTVYDLMSPALPELEKLRLSTDPKSSGDLILTFNPGWEVVDDSRFPSIIQDNKTEAYLFPGFILGKDISSKVVETQVEATVFTPTIASILKIKAPNAVTNKPMNLK